MLRVKRLVPAIAKAILPLSVRDALRPYWKRIADPPGEVRRAREIKKLGPVHRWPAAQKEEIDFWDKVLNRELWPEVRDRHSDPNLPLQPYLIELLDNPPGSRVEILDVGSGPLSFLGKKWEGRELHITAIDPNAGSYDALLLKYGIDPPVRARPGYAEELTSVVPASAFDLVHARNCIDHSKDPLRAIAEMVRAVKPGCYVFLNHKICEGRSELYTGPHQWNFFPEDGHFFIERPGMARVDVGSIVLGGLADVSVGASADGPAWFSVTIKRRA